MGRAGVDTVTPISEYRGSAIPTIDTTRIVVRGYMTSRSVPWFAVNEYALRGRCPLLPAGHRLAYDDHDLTYMRPVNPRRTIPIGFEPRAGRSPWLIVFDRPLVCDSRSGGYLDSTMYDRIIDRAMVAHVGLTWHIGPMASREETLILEVRNSAGGHPVALMMPVRPGDGD